MFFIYLNVEFLSDLSESNREVVHVIFLYGRDAAVWNSELFQLGPTQTGNGYGVLVTHVIACRKYPTRKRVIIDQDLLHRQ